MKKITLICIITAFLVIILGSARVIADNQEISRNDIRTINAYLRSKIIFWQKLYDCTSYNTTIGTQYFEIIGKENHNCHVKIQNVDCYYPMDVAKKYSYNAENMLRKAIDELNSRGDINQTAIEEEVRYIQRINYQYCKNTY